MSVQLPSQSWHQTKHLFDRSDSNSSGRSIDDSFWIKSPSPEAEEEKDDEGKEWAFEIVGEEVDADGQIR
jgi:histone-lysine N-methyltransferase SUV39H